MTFSKLTPLRPSRKWTGERPSRQNLRAWFCTPKGRVFLLLAAAAAGVCLRVAPAAAANPPDPITKAYGKPSATYTKKQGRYLLVCQLWLYTKHGVRMLSIERCVTYGLARPNAPTAKGPSS